MKEINLNYVNTIITKFENDFDKYTFINDNRALRNKAKELISKYGSDGLRTLDSIQLASALMVKKSCNAFHTSDILLNELFKKEKLTIL